MAAKKFQSSISNLQKEKDILMYKTSGNRTERNSYIVCSSRFIFDKDFCVIQQVLAIFLSKEK